MSDPHPSYGVGAQGASLADILTAIQTLFKTLASGFQTVVQINGATNAAGLTSATLVKTGAGRLAAVSVTTAGSAPGAVYDSTSVGTPLNPVFSIPAALGLTVANIPLRYGLVVVPGAGMTVAVVYS